MGFLFFILDYVWNVIADVIYTVGTILHHSLNASRPSRSPTNLLDTMGGLRGVSQLIAGGYTERFKDLLNGIMKITQSLITLLFCFFHWNGKPLIHILQSWGRLQGG